MTLLGAGGEIRGLEPVVDGLAGELVTEDPVEGVRERREQRQGNLPLAHVAQHGAHEFPGVATPPVGGMYHDAEMPPMGRGTPFTKDSSGSTVALALASPSSSMTCTCSRSSLALWSGSNISSQAETLLSKAATARRASASTSPSLYLRSSIILRTVEIRQDST